MRKLFSKSIAETLGIRIDNYDTLAVRKLSRESAVRVGQVDVYEQLVTVRVALWQSKT